MSGRIRAFQIVLVLAVVAIGATAWLSVRGAHYYLDQVQLSRRQADAATELAVLANRFSEQIAELLLIGEAERAEFEDARARMLAQLDLLQRLSALDDDLIRDPKNEEEERQEAARIDRMRVLAREIDRAVERMLLLNRQGRRDDAVALFRAEIENRFDEELSKLVAEAKQDEQGDVAEADAIAKRLSNALMVGAFVVLGLLLALIVAAGVAFTRSLRRKIGALAAGAQAIGHGDLGHRVADDGEDEFAKLAGRFNAMSEQLQRQRGELVAARDTLEDQVAKRTGEIARANEQLTALDRQRVRFFGDVSHELKTPIAVLRAEAEIALRARAAPEHHYRAALESVAAQAADMGRLVDDLLFIARSEADEIRFELRPVGLDEAVGQAVQDARPLAEARGMRIALDSPDPAPVARADPRWMKQALLVMLDNAARYGDEGSEIKVDIRFGEAGWAEIAVRDRGPGVPPEEAPHVFDRFFRGAHGRESCGGSGLGLSIARWIVEKHGGRITLTSVPGEGAAFLVLLPVEP